MHKCHVDIQLNLLWSLVVTCLTSILFKPYTFLLFLFMCQFVQLKINLILGNETTQGATPFLAVQDFLSKLILFYGYKQSLYDLESFWDFSLTFDRFSIENLRDLSKNPLTSSVSELEKCSFFLNRSEFHQKLIGTIIRGLVRNQRA